eukprot:242917_1
MSISVTPHIQVGDRVETKDNYRGTCQYVGQVKGLNNNNNVGIFVGIELDEFISNGHDGSNNNIQYFNCNNGHGIFIPIEECIKIDNKKTINKNGYNTYNEIDNGYINAEIDNGYNNYNNYNLDNKGDIEEESNSNNIILSE